MPAMQLISKRHCLDIACLISLFNIFQIAVPKKIGWYPMTEEGNLTYFLAEKNGVLVVSFIGPLVRSNAHILDRCLKDVLARQVDWVIVSLRDVPGTVDRAVFPTFARFQKAVRDKKARLILASLHPVLHKALNDQAIVRPEESANNLADALSRLVAPKVRAA